MFCILASCQMWSQGISFASSVGYGFFLLMVSYDFQKLLSFMRSPLLMLVHIKLLQAQEQRVGHTGDESLLRQFPGHYPVAAVWLLCGGGKRLRCG